MPPSLAAKLAGIALAEAGGRRIRLGELWAQTPVLLSFLRHYGWIFCRQHVAQLREAQNEFEQKGITLAAIGLGDMAYAQRFREETGISFPLLVDDERKAYRAAGLASASVLHLLRGDNFRWRKRASAAGHRQHQLGKNPFQLGATFVFAPPDRVLYQHLSQTFGDNPSPEEILRAVS